MPRRRAACGGRAQHACLKRARTFHELFILRVAQTAMMATAIYYGVAMAIAYAPTRRHIKKNVVP